MSASASAAVSPYYVERSLARTDAANRHVAEARSKMDEAEALGRSLDAATWRACIAGWDRFLADERAYRAWLGTVLGAG